MKKRIHFNGQKSFSLVEMLIVITIIAIMSVFLIPNFREGEAQMRLQRSANKLYQDVRRVQEMAISSRICTECTSDPNSPPLKGYGLALAMSDFTSYLDNTKYIIYAHNQTEAGEYFYYPTTDFIVETVNFEKGVYVKDIVDVENGYSYDHLGLNFIPPEPSMGMQCNVCGHVVPRIAKVILGVEGYPDKTKIIYTNIAGLIYELN
jgi:prepilin-type N-terminal cleavage/methylation domain-containing protein